MKMRKLTVTATLHLSSQFGQCSTHIEIPPPSPAHFPNAVHRRSITRFTTAMTKTKKSPTTKRGTKIKAPAMATPPRRKLISTTQAVSNKGDVSATEPHAHVSSKRRAKNTKPSAKVPPSERKTLPTPKETARSPRKPAPKKKKTQVKATPPSTPDTVTSSSPKSTASKRSITSEVRQTFGQELDITGKTTIKKLLFKKKTPKKPSKTSKDTMKSKAVSAVVVKKEKKSNLTPTLKSAPNKIDWFKDSEINKHYTNISGLSPEGTPYEAKVDIILHKFTPKELLAVFLIISPTCDIDIGNIDLESNFTTRTKGCEIILSTLCQYRDRTISLDDEMYANEEDETKVNIEWDLGDDGDKNVKSKER
jgi:hypothetical protein